MSTKEDHEQTKNWVKTWQRAGVELDQIRADELASMSDEDTRRALHKIMNAAEPAWFFSLDRPVTGLIEQQKLFRKLR